MAASTNRRSTSDQAGGHPAVSVLGLGTMGSAMAGRLVHAGLETVVWDRSPDTTVALAREGAAVAASPLDAAARADIVITMLPTEEVVTAVVDDGVLGALPSHAIWSQMGTIGLDATERLRERAGQLRPDVLFVDAPVSGTKGPAQTGQLLILASGPPKARPRLESVYAAIGRRTMWLGEAGSGSRMKLVLNTWLAFLMEGIAETSAFAEEIGVTREQLLDVLNGGPLAVGAALAKLHKIDSGTSSPSSLSRGH